MKKNHPNVLALDFDHTIFHTTRFVNFLRDAFQQHGISPEVFSAQRESLKSSYAVFELDRFIHSFSTFEPQVLHALIHKTIHEHAPDCVYDDVRPFIERHHQTFDIVIVSQGDEEFQLAKIQQSRLPHIHEVRITQTSKVSLFSSFIHTYERVVYIEDKPQHIDEIVSTYPTVEAYSIRRFGDAPYGDISPESAKVKVITELDHLQL